MPKDLRTLFDRWDSSPPIWQHQIYGPLNTYFVHQFPNYFIIKLQALLRNKLGTLKNIPPNVDGDEDVEMLVSSLAEGYK